MNISVYLHWWKFTAEWLKLLVAFLLLLDRLDIASAALENEVVKPETVMGELGSVIES